MLVLLAMLVQNLNTVMDTHIEEATLNEFFTAADDEEHKVLNSEEITKITVTVEKLFSASFSPDNK